VSDDNTARTLYRVENGVAWITLNRPEVLNCFGSADYVALRSLIRRAEHDRSVDVIVITGRGRAFATGGDLKEVRSYFVEDADELEFYQFIDQTPFDALRRCPKTVIAAVNGLCVAGGIVVALCSDFIIACDSAEFGTPEARVGLTDPFTASLLPQRIGMGRVRQMLFTGKFLDSATALQIGLIDAVVPAEGLTDAVEAMIAEVRTTSPAARAQYKRYLRLHDPPIELEFPIADRADTLARLAAFEAGNSHRQVSSR